MTESAENFTTALLKNFDYDKEYILTEELRESGGVMGTRNKNPQRFSVTNSGTSNDFLKIDNKPVRDINKFLTTLKKKAEDFNEKAEEDFTEMISVINFLIVYSNLKYNTKIKIDYDSGSLAVHYTFHTNDPNPKTKIYTEFDRLYKAYTKNSSVGFPLVEKLRLEDGSDGTINVFHTEDSDQVRYKLLALNNVPTNLGKDHATEMLKSIGEKDVAITFVNINGNKAPSPFGPPTKVSLPESVPAAPGRGISSLYPTRAIAAATAVAAAPGAVFRGWRTAAAADASPSPAVPSSPSSSTSNQSQSPPTPSPQKCESVSIKTFIENIKNALNIQVTSEKLEQADMDNIESILYNVISDVIVSDKNSKEIVNQIKALDLSMPGSFSAVRFSDSKRQMHKGLIEFSNMVQNQEKDKVLLKIKEGMLNELLFIDCNATPVEVFFAGKKGASRGSMLGPMLFTSIEVRRNNEGKPVRSDTPISEGGKMRRHKTHKKNNHKKHKTKKGRKYKTSRNKKTKKGRKYKISRNKKTRRN